ncbi:MAG: RNase adapter RapZ [Xanthomonadales bacterium]|nr:RNase adapter RapZ [Xanthomonadales bacterium]
MNEQQQKLILVSGLSGGGKSTALHALEDLGYYCVDNLPAALLGDFMAYIRSRPSRYSRVALGIDARSSADDLKNMSARLDQPAPAGLQRELMFLTADTKTLIKRFSETRRRHPLTTDQQALPQAIDQEKTLLEALHERADQVIDTTDTNIHQLRRQVWKCVDDDTKPMTIVLESFAFKRGVPQDVDFVFDARNLPNPHWEDALRDLNGLDEPVRQWLEEDRSVDAMRRDILVFLQNWLPGFQRSQRSYVTVGVGCTGGRHRSVYLVDRLATDLGTKFGTVLIHHRELQA